MKRGENFKLHQGAVTSVLMGKISKLHLDNFQLVFFTGVVQTFLGDRLNEGLQYLSWKLHEEVVKFW